MTDATGLLKKLGVKPGQAIGILGATSSQIADLLRRQCRDVELFDTLDDRRFDLIFCWPQPTDDLTARFAELQRHLVPDGAVWVIIRKKSSVAGRDTGFAWREMQAAALTTDLVDNKVVSLSDAEYATRFVIARAGAGSGRAPACLPLLSALDFGLRRNDSRLRGCRRPPGPC